MADTRGQKTTVEVWSDGWKYTHDNAYYHIDDWNNLIVQTGAAYCTWTRVDERGHFLVN